eukprot:TRINITY_DN55915_c0_g1_i1.p1 TRINITY_DN55915_c0_g1~~TRINITY_DN55915_c0_g1_i1.p1  ORF type:complete len:325 (-),score=24.81 TRINITY_DN55915_c0_g1_i1:20-994(-)
MVFIPLRPQLVSLFVTIGTLTAEICFLLSALKANSLWESHALSKGRSISVKHHIIRRRLITIVATIAFVSLETVVSLYSNTQFEPIRVEEQCTVATRGGGQNELTSQFEAITAGCLELNSTNFNQKFGNYSLDSNRLFCDDDVSYEYKTASTVTRSVANATYSCQENSCFFYELQDNEFFFSEAVFELDDSQQSMQFFRTLLHFDLKPELARVVRKLHVIRGSEFFVEELFLRARIFSSTSDQRCLVTKSEIEGTQVALAVLCVLLTMWLMSFLAFVIVCGLLRRKIVFDVDKTSHWIEKVLGAQIAGSTLSLCSTTKTIIVNE